MKTPLVSVIVPLYNYQQYIGDCIQSIKNQNYSNYELIVIDDCSTDKSFKRAKKHECGNIHVIQTDKNRGYSHAKNEGIIMSNGELITCLDADDLMTKDGISTRVRALQKHNVPFVHAQAVNMFGDMKLKDAYRLVPGKQKKPRIHAQTVMLRRWVHQKYGLYDENLRSRSDKEMWWRLFDKNKHDRGTLLIKKVFLPHYVAYYRMHNKSMMAMRQRNKKYNIDVTRKLEEAYIVRKRDGISKNNTRFLET